MEPFRPPQIKLETIHRTVLVTDARNSSKAYFSEKADEALVRIERDRALFAQIAAAYGGEEVRDRGDGSMFAFCSPVAAIEAAMAMQTEICRLNASLPPDSLRLVHRMGVHVGEIKLSTTRIVLDGVESIRRKLSGDIVVTAARLEAICHPGEVCFSNEVYKLVRGQILHPFLDLDSTLKGFDHPVRCWSSRLDTEWVRPLTAEEELGKQRRREEKRLREKWEREQRERRRYRIGLTIAFPVALGSMVAVLVQVDASGDHRLAAAWEGFQNPKGHSIYQAPRRSGANASSGPATVALGTFPSLASSEPTWKKPAVGVPPSPDMRRRVARIVREGIRSGNYANIGAQLADLNPPPPQYETIRARAACLEEAKAWLIERLGPDGAARLPLGKPVHKMAFLNGATEDSIAGIDADGVERRVAYGDLSPNDLYAILSTAEKPDEGETAPSPARCLRSLEALKRL